MKIAFATASLAALWFALVAEAQIEQLMLLHLRGDHFAHALTFAYLTVLGMLLWTPAWLVVCIMVVAGGMLELLQVPVGRDGEFSDWIASSAGVGIGALLFLGLWFCCSRWSVADGAGPKGNGWGS
ncbi:hypothetical protein [Mesorhizobium sp. 10J20-29]